MGRENGLKWKGKIEYIRKGKRDEVGREKSNKVERENEMKWKGKMGSSGMGIWDTIGRANIDELEKMLIYEKEKKKIG